MPWVDRDGVRIHYKTHGVGEPLMLITGLGGAGRAWGSQIARFASEFLTIVVDHRGTGRSDKPGTGYEMDVLAADMAAVVRAVGAGPAHIVGSSTGGAFAQLMALDQPDVVRSIVLVSSWARADHHFLHQFRVRRRILEVGGPRLYTEASALALFSPRFMRDHFDAVEAWCERATAGTDPDIMRQRIDMILGHDTYDRLGDIDVPALVLVGSEDACTPPVLSRELAEGIPGAIYTEMPGGHLVYLEEPERFHDLVRDFLRSL